MGQIIAWLRGDDADNMFLDLDSTFLLPANAFLYISFERTGLFAFCYLWYHCFVDVFV